MKQNACFAPRLARSRPGPAEAAAPPPRPPRARAARRGFRAQWRHFLEGEGAPLTRCAGLAKTHAHSALGIHLETARNQPEQGETQLATSVPGRKAQTRRTPTVETKTRRRRRALKMAAAKPGSQERGRGGSAASLRRARSPPRRPLTETRGPPSPPAFQRR